MIATAILSKKSGGCNYNGSVTQNVTEPASGQVYPVKFDRAIEIPILIRVTIYPLTAVVDPEAAIVDAILKYATGQIDGEDGFVVGGSVSPFELAGAITCLYPAIFVRKVEISLLSPISYSTNELLIPINSIATISPGNISVITL